MYQSIILFFSLTLFVNRALADDFGLYYNYVNEPQILFTHLDNQEGIPIYDSPVNISMKVDPVGKKLYWIADNQGSFWRSDLSGANAEELFSLTKRVDILDFSIDLSRGELYWSEFDLTGCRVKKSSFDGSNRLTIHSGTGTNMGVEFIPTLDKLFFLSDFGLESINPDLSGREVILAGDPSIALYLEYDYFDDQLYWLHIAPQVEEILKTDLNGSFIEVVANELDVIPECLSINSSCHELFWIGPARAINKMDLNTFVVESLALPSPIGSFTLYVPEVFGDVLSNWPSAQSGSCFSGRPGILLILDLLQ